MYKYNIRYESTTNHGSESRVKGFQVDCHVEQKLLVSAFLDFCVLSLPCSVVDVVPRRYVGDCRDQITFFSLFFFFFRSFNRYIKHRVQYNSWIKIENQP
jgi:hypothetical protein